MDRVRILETDLYNEHYKIAGTWKGLDPVWVAKNYKVPLRTVESTMRKIASNCAANPSPPPEPKPARREGLNLAKCRSCGASIYFRETKEGKLMPVETAPIKILDWQGNIVEGHEPHWSKCPDADKFRKK